MPIGTKDIMTRQVVSVRPDASIVDAADLMLKHRISGLPVVSEQGKLIGIVTDRDLLRRRESGAEPARPRWLEFLVAPRRLSSEYELLQSRKVSDVMTPNPISIDEDATLDHAVRLMNQHRIKRIPVLRKDQLVGIIAREDIVAALARGKLSPATSEDVARLARSVELERQFWTSRTRPSS